MNPFQVFTCTPSNKTTFCGTRPETQACIKHFEAYLDVADASAKSEKKGVEMPGPGQCYSSRRGVSMKQSHVSLLWICGHADARTLLHL